MEVIVKNGKGKLKDSQFWLPLTDDKIPDGTYQGYNVDQYCKENKLGGIYWMDGLSHEYSTREAIRITNYNRPKQQHFERFPKLAKHIERMASTGQTGSGSEWNDFLYELNRICAS